MSSPERHRAASPVVRPWARAWRFFFPEKIKDVNESLEKKIEESQGRTRAAGEFRRFFFLLGFLPAVALLVLASSKLGAEVIVGGFATLLWGTAIWWHLLMLQRHDEEVALREDIADAERARRQAEEQSDGGSSSSSAESETSWPASEENLQTVLLANEELRRSALRHERRRVRHRLRIQTWLRNLFTAGLLAWLIVLAALPFRPHTSVRSAAVMAAALAVLVFSLQVSRTRARELETDIRQLDYESAVVGADERFKPEILFLKHQFELRRYYSQTLRHGAQVFALGIALLALGAGIVIAALVIISRSDQSLGINVVIAALAAISGLLTNYVARIYFRMHNQAMSAVTEFHERLVRDHNFHFANLLLADPEQRNVNIVEVAMVMAQASAGPRPSQR